MTDFGGKLRLARERRGMSVRQIAERTKISAATLEALERNDLSRLPGGIFSRAFVKAYAEEVGLDPERTVREFLDLHDAEPAPVRPVVELPESDSAFDSQRRIAIATLTLIVASLAVAIAMLVFSFNYRTPTPAAVPAEREAAMPVPAALPPAPVEASVPAAARPQAGFVLELHPTAPCWISLTIDGEPRLQRLVEAGERLRYGIEGLAVIQVGDAQAFAYSIDGAPGRSLGGPGEVRTARITKGTLSDFLR